MANSGWMGQYQDRMLSDLHLPGSHDAGTIAEHVEFAGFGSASNAVTQNLTILEQLTTGTRFFDLRLQEHGGQIVAHHTTRGHGAFGTTPIGDSLSEAALFCDANRTEVVIFRISHTKATTAAHHIAADAGLGAFSTAKGNLCEKTLSEIKTPDAFGRGGGLICIFDNKEFGHMIDQTEGIHSFAKYSSVPSNLHGISTCGEYSSTHTLDTVIQNGLRGQYEHCTSHDTGSHLWQVYWQKTYVNPRSRTSIESGAKKSFKIKKGRPHGGTHAATGHMIKLMQGHSPGLTEGEDYVVGKEKVPGRFYGETTKKIMHSTLAGRNFLLPNIISYDFVNEEMNRKIIALNEQGVQPAIIDDEDDGEWV